MKILVATDGSPMSNLALDEIARRPWPDGSELRIVNVIDHWPAIGNETLTLPPEYFDEIAATTQRESERILAAARERVAGIQMKSITSKGLLGAPAQTILYEAERWGADLIVLGSHGYGIVKRFLLGSVSHAVSLNATCSVEVVRQREAA